MRFWVCKFNFREKKGEIKLSHTKKNGVPHILFLIVLVYNLDLGPFRW